MQLLLPDLHIDARLLPAFFFSSFLARHALLSVPAGPNEKLNRGREAAVTARAGLFSLVFFPSSIATFNE